MQYSNWSLVVAAAAVCFGIGVAAQLVRQGRPVAELTVPLILWTMSVAVSYATYVGIVAR